MELTENTEVFEQPKAKKKKTKNNQSEWLNPDGKINEFYVHTCILYTTFLDLLTAPCIF